MLVTAMYDIVHNNIIVENSQEFSVAPVFHE